jgi:AcrR family transcriptional regulator
MATRKRLTRVESQAQTQQRLLDAAAAIVARRGFAGASIEDIAETAGYSRGAFHANFKSKDELFLALIERHVKAMLSEIHKMMMDASLSPDEMQKSLRAACACYTGSDKETYLLLTEAQLYAVRNPRFGKKLSALFGAIYDGLLSPIEYFQKQTGFNDTSARQLVLIGFALSHGLILHNLMDPMRYPEETVSNSIEFVFDRIFPQAK